MTAGGALRLAREKLPLFALSAASAAVTLVAGWGAVAPLGSYPLAVRLANAPVAYAFYLWKTVLPSSLSVLYPHPYSLGREIPAWQWGGALVLLGGISAAVWILRRHRFAAVGWLWYLGTLVPVIGLVQAGEHGRADRYTYLPLVGIFLAVSWGGPALLGDRMREKGVRVGLAAAASLCVLSLSAAARVQAGYWKDPATLLRHAEEATGENHLVWNGKGIVLYDEGRYQEAAAAFRESLRIAPSYPLAWHNLGLALVAVGDYGRAEEAYRQGLRIWPEGAGLWRGLATLQGSLLRYDRAAESAREAVRLRPDDADGWYQLGNALGGLGRMAEAEEAFREAIRRNPGSTAAWHGLGRVLSIRGDRDGVLSVYRELGARSPAAAEEFLRMVSPPGMR